ncbi:hypothetical protein DL96DRAFT_1606680 [Flagelloscypha sp. PMI_526]|nr:hypothetical protein DL96DRAFT_1606680 [Flagelloscypha sp. PMI_526]
MRPLTHSFTHSSTNVHFLSWFSLFFIFALLPSGYAARNISIDDTNGDSVNNYALTFTPPEVWESSTCSRCRVAPDPKLSFDGTYKNALISGPTGNVEAQIQVPFVGTNVFVFMAVADRKELPPTNCNFTIDGQFAGSFSWSPGEGGSNQDYIYSMLAFSTEDLSDQEHFMVISSAGTTGGREDYLNIDRVVYTLSGDDPTSSNGAAAGNPSSPSATPVPGNGANVSGATSTGKNNTAVIAGAVVGSLVFIAIVGILIFLWLRRRKAASMSPSQMYLNSQGRNQPISSTDDLIEKGISLAKVDSVASSMDDEKRTLPDLPKIQQPKYPGGYVPGGISVPPQVHVSGGSGLQPVGSPTKSAGLTTRMSTLSGYSILQRASYLINGQKRGSVRNSSGKLQISAPTLDPVETRKARLREFERQQWKVRMDVKELEDQIEATTDEREKERLKIRKLRLGEDLVMISVQQHSLADTPISLESPTKDTV